MSSLILNSDSLDFGSTVNLVLKSESSHKRDLKPKKGCISMRFYLAFLSLFGCLVLYVTRVNLSVAIVAMVNQTNTQNEENHTIIELSCDVSDSNNNINQTSFNIKKCKS